MGEKVQRRAQGPLPVHALMLVEPLVLDGYGGVQQILGQFAVLRQHPVLLTINRLPLLPLPGLLVLVVDKRAQGHGIVIGIDHQRRRQGRIHVLHENTKQQSACADANQQQRTQHTEDLSGYAAPLSGFSLTARDPLRPFVLFQ